MTTEHAAPAEDPSFRTPCMVGALIGFVVFTIGCTWLGLAAGSNFAGALGLDDRGHWCGSFPVPSDSRRRSRIVGHSRSKNA